MKILTVLFPKWEDLTREARADLSCPSSSGLEREAAARSAIATGRFQTALVSARDRDDAFRLLNADDRANGRFMRSMSVGDLVVEDGRLYQVHVGGLGRRHRDLRRVPQHHRRRLPGVAFERTAAGGRKGSESEWTSTS